jgi:hypothetical protein
LHRIPTKNPMMGAPFDQNSSVAAADLFEDQPDFPVIQLSPAPQKSPVKSVPSFKVPHTPEVSSNLTNEIIFTPVSNDEVTPNVHEQHIYAQGYHYSPENTVNQTPVSQNIQNNIGKLE